MSKTTHQKQNIWTWGHINVQVEKKNKMAPAPKGRLVFCCWIFVCLFVFVVVDVFLFCFVCCCFVLFCFVLFCFVLFFLFFF